MDSAAWRMLDSLPTDVARKIKHAPVISIDFLLKYLVFGPRREFVAQSSSRLPYVFAMPILDIPRNLLEVATQARADSAGREERIIQRRIRDALDREKLKAGPVQLGGLDNTSKNISAV
jgi:hypothetical protein